MLGQAIQPGRFAIDRIYTSAVHEVQLSQKQHESFAQFLASAMSTKGFVDIFNNMALQLKIIF